MRFFVKLGLLTFSVFIFPVVLLLGQVSVETFGKNRLQYKVFNWRFYSTDNFDVYFYDDGIQNAKKAVKFLEEEFDGITEVLGYAPYNKTKIFLYNSVTDMQQSNIGVNESNFTVGGQTNFVKSHVEIAYPGTFSQFKQELKLKVTDMLINDMMFGGSLTDMFQSSYLLSLPDWFIEGAASYIAYDWSVDMDDYMRDLLLHNSVKKLTKFSGSDASIVGHSIWNYIAENYGRSNISNILNLTRIIRNEENSVANTLGLPFKQFLYDWQLYYRGMGEEISREYEFAKEENRLRKKNPRELIVGNPKISPDGKYVAFTENYKGKFKIVIFNLETGKEDKIYTGGYKVVNQEVDFDLPVLNWRDNNTLTFVAPRRGRLNLFLYDLLSGSKQRKSLERFNHIKNYDFSQNGRLVIISADVEGQNDLFLLSMRRNALKRLTRDVYDDIDPRFVPNTTAIVFSSNRPTDSLNASGKDLSNISENYDIFLYDLDTSTNLLINLSKTISKDISPIPVGSSIFYLSDQKGIFNLYKYDLDNRVFQQVTNYGVSIQEFDLNRNAGLLSYKMLDEGSEFIFVERDFDFDRQIFSPPTKRKIILQAKYLSNRIRKNAFQLNLENQLSGESFPATDQESQGSEEDVTADTLAVDTLSLDTLATDTLATDTLATDTLAADTLTTEGLETGLLVPDSLQFVAETETEIQTADTLTDIIDTDNYVFETEEQTQDRELDIPTFLENYRKSQKEKAVSGPHPYKTRFSADNIVTSLVIDPLLGFGIKLETQMNDILENHKFYGGILATADLRSGDIFAEYQYLKYMIDYRARFDRNVIYIEEEQVIQKYALNSFELGGSLPLSVTSRISLNPFYAFTQFWELNPDILRSNPIPPNPNIPDPQTQSDLHYLGLKAEYVFDNSVLAGLNTVVGTKAKIKFTHYEGVTDSKTSFSNISLDTRHYQKIHRELVFATRLYYGRFFGKSPKSYLLGGMDNWLFNKTDGGGQGDPLYFENYRNNSDILFANFMMPLRGFNYNKFNGENVFLINAELRFPVIRYFHRGPISSNFLRNLQLTGFFDFGSAWTGSTPFATENSLNTIIVGEQGSPFQARIKNFNNPWLYSYGIGVRTVLLGYYMKFDTAWPIENYSTGSPKFYVTLGYDF